ncbi:MAG: Crp/Fnr family transcriptional regulator [Chitinivorax sp.]
MAQHKLDIRGVLANLPLFRNLDPEEIDRVLLPAVREIRAERGDTLFQKSDPLSGLYVIVYGQVKLAFPSATGSEKVLQIFGAGESFGEAVMFLERPAPVYAQTLIDSLILLISKQAIFDAIERDPTFARRMLAGLSMRLHALVQDVESYSLRSAAQRVIGYLLQSAPECESGQVEVTLPASKHVIASRLNLTPETLSRIFSQLTHENLISVSGRDVTVHDVTRLQAYE